MDTSKFLPTPELQAEFERFKQLQTDDEKRKFQEERQAKLDAMMEEEREAYLNISESALKATINEAKNFIEKADDALLRDKLGEIPEVISLSYIAKKYFGKSRNWLYQRINGYLVNGKPARFTEEERKKFIAAINDISDILKKTSLSLG
ncbi:MULTISPECIES: DUF5053 domain-containing protein [Butyricimonas]|uniref:DUF5053 domain-containing protein n=1 Tax=Butyricimonas TaxID=574697 RepID=UPI0007FB56D6|nr:MULTISPECIES: DUF5053 domain-containing protein [Butyricimonas]